MKFYNPIHRLCFHLPSFIVKEGARRDSDRCPLFPSVGGDEVQTCILMYFNLDLTLKEESCGTLCSSGVGFIVSWLHVTQVVPYSCVMYTLLCIKRNVDDLSLLVSSSSKNIHSVTRHAGSA